jgi:hypothetical protein
MRAQCGSVWLSAWLCAAAASSTFAQPGDQAKLLSVRRFEAAPVIDGRLDEPVWREAAALRDFRQTQPGDNTPPSYPTTIMLGYDRERLYLGVRAADDPKKVRSTVARRDDITGDDYIAIYLDTFNDRRRAYLLMFNPLGAQQDGLFSEGSEPDFSVDVVMESKGTLTEEGYTIEVAIPFKSLRYEAGKGRLWGVHALRYIRHLDEEDSWAPLKRDKAGLDKASSKETRARFLAQAGHITGLEEVATERAMEIIPVLTVAETGRRAPALPFGASLPGQAPLGRFVNQSINADAGLTGKLRLTPGVTFDFALNPDFAEVEADQAQVTANQRFPLFFEERRPFFLEGADIFRTPIRTFHSRTIIDPDVALKLSGKRGRTNFGALLASDKAPGNFSEDERNDPAQFQSISRFIDHNAYAGVLRVSPAALANPDAPLDPGPGNTNDITASFIWRPAEAFRASIDYTKSRLVRIDTRRTAYDQNLWSLRASYYFTRFTFARARVDYDTLAARVRGQFLLGWTPHPGTSLYVGYNDDLNYNGHSPFTNQFERGLRRNQRTFFIKMSYLIRRGL